MSNLVTGKTYCIKMFLNLQNDAPMSLASFGIYLSDSSVDTISYCSIPLSYLIPQIQNPSANFITDTLGWVEVSGTFTATGNEKYLVIGNFKSDAATTTSITGVGSGNWSEYNVDDISVIDFNLPAFAGPDKNINLGDSAFIGRPPEIGLECTWATGTTTIGTGGGLWVKPTSTGTFSYVVTQNICGNIKTDTVNVNVSPGLVNENELFANSISVYPQPAKDVVTISLSNYYESNIEIKVYDLNGRLLRHEDGIVKNGQVTLNTTELNDAVYSLQFINHTGQIANKRLVITK
ncbi:MAG: T9SS type A sorting domain-containing protein [Bacteroidia bacterium]|nr:T9SS type A sorting domain-containing protein [Bacteroidia bacterium]